MKNRTYERALTECRRNPIDPPLLQWKDYLTIAVVTVMAGAIGVVAGTAITFSWGHHSPLPSTFIHEQDHAR